MAEPARILSQPSGPRPAAPSGHGAAVTTIAVPVTVWPGIPGPGWCPAISGQLPCARRYPLAATRAVISALSSPGDVVFAPAPGDEVFLVAAASTGRRAAGQGATSPAGQHDHSTGAAALAVVTACPAPCFPPPGPAGAGTSRNADLRPLYTACRHALQPGGMLAVITAAVRQPGWASQVIAHARAAGLLYAQHVVALHAALGDDRLLSPCAPLPGSAPAASPGQLTHLPVHTDLLLFTQPGGARHD